MPETLLSRQHIYGKGCFAHSDHYWGCRGYTCVGRGCWWCCNVRQMGSSQLPALNHKLATVAVLKARAKEDDSDIYEGAEEDFELCFWCWWSLISGLSACSNRRFVDTVVEAYGHVSVWLAVNQAAKHSSCQMAAVLYTHPHSLRTVHGLALPASVITHYSNSSLLALYNLWSKMNNLPNLRYKETSLNSSTAQPQASQTFTESRCTTAKRLFQSPLMVQEHSLGVC